MLEQAGAGTRIGKTGDLKKKDTLLNHTVRKLKENACWIPPSLLERKINSKKMTMKTRRSNFQFDLSSEWYLLDLYEG